MEENDHVCGLVVTVPGYITEKNVERLCGLVVRVPGYRSRGPGSIPGAIRFSEK
jgi:hypothetical protein